MERSEEATLEGKLSSLVGQKNSDIIRHKSNWALLASLAHDKYVIVEGLGYTCRDAAEKEGLHLVGVGDMTCNVSMAFWPGAGDLVRIVDRIMAAKEWFALSAVACGLQIYEQVGREYRLILPSSATRINMPMFGQLQDVLELKPPSVVAPPVLRLFGAHASGNAFLPIFIIPDLQWDSSQMRGCKNVLPHHPIHDLEAEPTINRRVQDFRRAATSYEITLARPSPATSRIRRLYDAVQQAASGIVPGRMSGIVPEASDYIVYSNFSSHNYGTGAGGHSLRSPGGRLTVDLSELDLEVGGQQLSITRNDGARRTDSGETWDVAKKLEGVMGQGFFVCLPLCLTAYSQLKDAPDYVQFITFGGLAFITAGFAIGMLCKSVARRRLAIRLVSSTAITVLAFSIASQLSGATYKALTALVATALNFIIMLLPF